MIRPSDLYRRPFFLSRSTKLTDMGRRQQLKTAVAALTTAALFTHGVALSGMFTGAKRGYKRASFAWKAAASDSENEYVPTARNLVPRYMGPPVKDMTAEQKKIRYEILKTRPRTGLVGPFGPWLACPDIAAPAQELGRACRYGTSLSFDESELIILLTGAKMKSHAEFDIHVGEALKSGLSMELIHAIPRDDEFSVQAVQEKVLPVLSGDSQEKTKRLEAIALFTAELVDTCTVSDDTYQTTRAALGGEDSVLVEITSIAGYYAYVAYTLNVFQIPSS